MFIAPPIAATRGRVGLTIEEKAQFQQLAAIVKQWGGHTLKITLDHLGGGVSWMSVYLITLQVPAMLQLR